MSTVTWQGGCELRDAEGTRIGNLYVTSAEVVFIEAGRGGMTQYRPALFVAALAGVCLVVPLAIEIWAWTWHAGARSGSVVGLEVAAGLMGLVFGGIAAKVALNLKSAYRAGLLELGADEGTPDVATLREAAETVKGSLSLPRGDAESFARNGERLTMETRLGETWDLLILPDPDAFVRAVKG